MAVENESNVTYAIPLLNKGAAMPIYACSQGTCNGKSHNVCSTDVEDSSGMIRLKQVV